MGLNIADNYLQETAFIVAILGLFLAIVATALRFVAVRRAGRKPGWEDWFAVLATFFFALYVIPLLYLLTIMNGKPLAKLTKVDVVKITKAGYSMAAQFCMQQLFAKFSLFFLYYRVFYISRRFVSCVYFLGTVQLLWSVATYLVHYFLCTPIKKLWEPRTPGHCINNSAFLAAGETPNSLVDFALVGLAIWMVYSIPTVYLVKWKLSVIFAIGGLAGILGFVKIGEGFTPMSTIKIELMDPIWACVQQTCSVICCCAPVYKPLIPEFGVLDRLRSFSSRAFSGRRSSNRSRSEDQHQSDGSPTKEISVGKTQTKPDVWAQLDNWREEV